MVNQVRIGNLNIGQGHKPVFIAEIGINHGGSLATALDLVDAAVAAGADIVKFQHHLPELEMSGNHVWRDLMIKCALPVQELAEIQMYVEKEGKEFLCTPFCKEAADELDIIGVRGFKTGSGECNNIPFLEVVAAYDKPMLISTGMTSRDELFATLNSVLKINNKVVLLNCTSTYPAEMQEARLRRIEWLYSTFNLSVGQSDHTPTISTALGAIARGAVCIEKHITLDKGAEGPDHAASILPSEFKQMTQMGMEIWEGMHMCIEAEMGVLPRELPVKEIANHSVVASQRILKGEHLVSGNTTTMRPGTGVPAAEMSRVWGKKVIRDIDSGEIISYTDLA